MGKQKRKDPEAETRRKKKANSNDEISKVRAKVQNGFFWFL